MPPQPPPAPAKREAAIAAALRRFEREATVAPETKPRRLWHNRPHMAGLAVASLVLVIGVPVAWQALDRGAFRAASGLDRAQDREPSAVVAVPVAQPDVAPAAAPQSAPSAAVRASSAIAVPPVVAGRNALQHEPGTAVQGADAPVAPPPPPAPPAPSVAVPAAPGPALREASRLAPDRGFSINRSAAPAPASAPAPALAAKVANQTARGQASGNEDRDIVVTSQRVTKAEPGAAARQTNETEASAALDRGLALARAGDSAGALAEMTRAVRLAPGSARAHFERGKLLRARGDERRARTEFARAGELDPAFLDPGE